jgi:hypothetical protein
MFQGFEQWPETLGCQFRAGISRLGGERPPERSLCIVRFSVLF